MDNVLQSSYIYCDEEQRLIFLFGEIDNNTIGYVYSVIMSYIALDNNAELTSVDENGEEIEYVRTPIRLFINSHGGDIGDMWALIDLILTSPTPIETFCPSYCQSAGLKIFLAGHTRYIFEHTTFLYHQISSCVDGKFQDIIENQREFEWQQDAVEKYVAKRTLIDIPKLKEVREKKQDWVIHSEEAIALGIAHYIVEEDDVLYERTAYQPLYN